ncbi:formin-like protein 7 [Gigantopelta aegis]|uniref:formin-like protein 7 n=1 Tax=Gigantopelta aegis TaxID=1735272 RepID=UPI001B888826|nr:formin-like protein 7 [Gigantopelta aegis]
MPRQQSVAEEYVLLPPPTGGIQRPQPFGAKPPPPKEPPPPDTGLGELEDIFSGGSSMLPPLPEINTTLNPFGATQAPPPPTYPPSQPSYPLGPSMTPQEPSITMDLMDAVRNPPPGTTSYPQGMGMGPFGGPQYPGQQFPGTSFGGGPYVGTGPFATGSGGGLYGNIPGVPAPNDIFSMPADPLLDTTFSQPLLPTNTQKTDTASGGPKGQGGSGGDAFSDLVSMARNKASATTAASTKSVEFLPVRSSPPPLPYRPPNLGQESTDRGRLKPEMLSPFEENFSTGKQTPPLPLHQSLSDPFGDNFTFSQAPPPESFPQSSGGGGWVSF